MTRITAWAPIANTLPLLLLCACLEGGPVEPELQGSGTRILFIGNSLTYVNDVPGILQALADSAGGKRLAVETVAFPNYALIDHWLDGSGQREIDKRGWAYVVLQQGWTPAGVCRDTLRLATKLFSERIKEIAIASGTIFQLDRSGRESVLSVPNTYRPGYGHFPGRGFDRSLTGDRRVRALVLEGGRLVAVVASIGELPFAPARSPTVTVINARNAGTYSAVEVGDQVSVIGSGFLPSSSKERRVQVLFDGRRVTIARGSIDVLASDQPAVTPGER